MRQDPMAGWRGSTEHTSLVLGIGGLIAGIRIRHYVPEAISRMILLVLHFS